MSFEQREKEKKILKRDEHGQIDKDDADKVTKKLVEDLITTQRDYQKDQMMKNARDNRRDVVVKIIVYQRNTINGIIVKEDYQNPIFENLSEDPLHPFRYNCFDYIDGEIMVKEMPMPMSHVGKWTMGCFKALVNYLVRMGVFNNV